MKALYDILPECIGTAGANFGLPLPPFLQEHIPTGMPRQMITILFSESGNFKTTLKANIVDHALSEGFRVLDFSLEDSAQLIGAMRLSRVTGIPYSRISNGELEDHERRALDAACQESVDSRRHLVIEEGEFAPNLANIERVCRALVKDGGLDMVCIDYAQLLDFSHVPGESSDRRGLEDAVKRLQSLAKELNIAVLLVSQVLRDRIYNRKDKRPNMKDLYGSSFLEFGCKLAIAAYRPWKYADENYEQFKDAYGEEQYKRILELWIRKNRFGETDVFTRAMVDLPTGRMERYEDATLGVPDEDEEIGF